MLLNFERTVRVITCIQHCEVVLHIPLNKTINELNRFTIKDENLCNRTKVFDAAKGALKPDCTDSCILV